MNKITIIAVTIMILTSCRKDIKEMQADTTVQTELASESNANRHRVTRPIKVVFESSANPTSPGLTCTLPGTPFAIANSGYFLRGRATHLGRIDAVKSKGQDGFCNLSPAFILTTSTAGQIVAANGDKITYIGDDAIDLNNVVLNGETTGTMTGLWTITGGTGRFSCASGSFRIQGTVDVAAAGGPAFSITGQGTITY